MRTTITEALVRGAKPGFIRDDRVVGFALRTYRERLQVVRRRGARLGRVRRFTLSPADRSTVAEARAQARQVLAGMSRGRDPAVVRRAKRERSRTLSAMLDEYIEARQVKASTGEVSRTVARSACLWRLARKAHCRDHPGSGPRALRGDRQALDQRSQQRHARAARGEPQGDGRAAGSGGRRSPR